MIDNKTLGGYFLNVFLQRPASSIPKGSMWAVFFADLNAIDQAINLAYIDEPNSEMWKTSQARKILLNPELADSARLGCLFCQAIDLPGEGSTPVAEGNLKYNGYIRGYVGAGRNDFPVMRMSFLETNVSFTDSFLRGWSLATSKFGMIARNGLLPSGDPDPKNYRTDIYCFKFIATPAGLNVRSMFYFKDACCVNVDNQELNYDPLTVAVKRSAQFVYNSYSIDTTTDVPQELFK